MQLSFAPLLPTAGLRRSWHGTSMVLPPVMGEAGEANGGHLGHDGAWKPIGVLAQLSDLPIRARDNSAEPCAWSSDLQQRIRASCPLHDDGQAIRWTKGKPRWHEMPAGLIFGGY
jgi:hypothetical protein